MAIYRKGRTETTLRPTRKRKHSIKVASILEIDFEDGLTIYAFPGTLSENDLLIKFKNKNMPRTQIRQPSHIHWAVDILIKKENNPDLTDEFLKHMLERWKTVEPLPDREYQTILNNLIISKDKKFIDKFQKLNDHGFFSIEFITHLMEILMIQEKTNNPEAYMFRDVVIKIFEYKDLYAIISNATHRGG